MPQSLPGECALGSTPLQIPRRPHSLASGPTGWRGKWGGPQRPWMLSWGAQVLAWREWLHFIYSWWKFLKNQIYVLQISSPGLWLTFHFLNRVFSFFYIFLYWKPSNAQILSIQLIFVLKTAYVANLQLINRWWFNAQYSEYRRHCIIIIKLARNLDLNFPTTHKKRDNYVM